MKTAPLLSPAQIEALVSQRSISDRHPWRSNDDQVIDGFYREVCAAVCQATNTLSRVEWNHYGSGYASFVDAWFYRESPDFKTQTTNPRQPACVGLVVLLSRLSPYFVLMEGRKNWGANGGGSNLPDFGSVDRLPDPAVAQLAFKVQPTLESFGLIRASREDLQAPLPPSVHVSSNLAGAAPTQFDALFYWMD